MRIGKCPQTASKTTPPSHCNCVAQWIAHQTSNLGVAGSSPAVVTTDGDPSTDWRNGSASDSSPEGYVFESRIGHAKKSRAPPHGVSRNSRVPRTQAAARPCRRSPSRRRRSAPTRSPRRRRPPRYRGRVLTSREGGVAQWQSVRFACGKPRVQTPAPPPQHTQLRGAMDSVSDFESGGCGFESRRSCSPIARRPFSIRGRVGLSSITTSQKGVGFKPQSLRRRGFEPHRMHT